MQQKGKDTIIESTKNIGRLINKFLKKVGLELKSYPDFDTKRRMKIIHHYKINTLLDIGANRGQYSENMREMGYTGKIISFEPLNSAFKELEKVSSKSKNWIVNNYALGNMNTKSTINVAGNSYSSSILEMLPNHLNSAPESGYIAQQEINIKTLDSIYKSFCSPKNNVMIKIDTQGYEKNVLEGANKSLKNIKIIQLEMSLLPLYKSEMLFIEMIGYLEKKGFQLFSLENGFADPSTGRLLQVDGIFVSKR